MQLALMLHTMAHLAPSWHIGNGRFGWWAFTTARETLANGYGVIRGHFAFSWEVRP